MGFLGRMTGWGRQKDAHNAVLADHLAKTASAELKKAIAERLVVIQQQAVGGGSGSPEMLLRGLSYRPRIVQMNFIALACNSMGIPPGLPGQSFVAVENPYLADNDSSLARIGVALDDLSRRSGQHLNWPGNDERIDFLSWAGLERDCEVLELKIEAPDERLNPEYAAHLAYRSLLAEVIDFDVIHGLAKELANAVGARSDKELALAMALFFFEREELIPHLHPVQMMARLTAAQWFQEGTVEPSAVRYFEEQLYNLYKR
jgi:hypothetical protein